MADAAILALLDEPAGSEAAEMLGGGAGPDRGTTPRGAAPEVAPKPRPRTAAPEPSPRELASSQALRAFASSALPLALAVTEPPERYAGYDLEKEDREYARSLLTTEEKVKLDAELVQFGHFTLPEIRALLAKNTGMRYLDDGVFSVDADLLLQIDQRTRDPVFILPDNTVFFRDKLLAAYPFELLGSTPEDIFAQQEVGVFEPGGDAPTQYLARDYGSEDEFVLIQDLVGGLTRASYKQRRRPARVVRTKVFLARQGWDDFQHIVRDLRAKRRLYANAARRWQETGAHNLLSLKMAAAPAPRRAIADTAAADADAAAADALAALLDAL